MRDDRFSSSQILFLSPISSTNSPTLFINGACVYGSLPSCSNMDPQSNMMLQAICQAYSGSKPAACNNNGPQ